MRLTIVLVTAVALLAAPAQSPEVQFRAAQQKETVDGDLPKAISLYRKLADDRSTPPEIAAMSLIQIGRCYERLGSGEARKAYQRVLEQFATQEAPAAEARRRLTALTGRAREESVVVRKLQGNLQGFVSNTAVPDGRQTVVSHGRTGLDLLDLQSGDRRPIQTTEPIGPPDATISGSSISPDGRRVVVDVSLGAGNSELRLIDMAKGTVRTLIKSDTAFRLAPLDWSRDGRIVLASPSEESALAQKTSNLALIEVESGNIHRMPVSGIVVDARLSPDNQFVAYTLTPGMPRYSRQGNRIFVARTDGSGSRLAAAPPAGGALAGWSPDSRYLLFASDDLGTDHLWAMRIRDGNPEGEPVSIAKGLARSDKLAVTAAGSVILTLMGGINCYSASLDPKTGAVTSRKT